MLIIFSITRVCNHSKRYHVTINVHFSFLLKLLKSAIGYPLEIAQDSKKLTVTVVSQTD